MSLRLREMTGPEFDAWRAAAVTAYAADVAHSYRLTAAEAAAKSNQSFDTLLPQGRETPDHQVRMIEDESGAAVGHLWIAAERIEGRDRLYVYDVAIIESERGRGFGREAMLLVEAEARALGLDRIELNVWPSNHVAHALYRSLDFEETSLGMVKLLGE